MLINKNGKPQEERKSRKDNKTLKNRCDVLPHESSASIANNWRLGMQSMLQRLIFLLNDTE